MVQEFHVLKCYSCEAFQVQQVKKSKKWNCKMCGEKQSIIKVFGRGSGVDCRRHVQKLNTRRGEILEDQNQKAWLQWENTGEEAEENELGDKAEERDNHTVVNIQGSRWSKYLLNPSGVSSSEEDGEENVYMDRNHSPACRNIRKRKRGRGGSTSQTREEHRETSQGQWKTAGKKTLAHPRTFPSSSAPAEGSASCRLAPARTNPSPEWATSQPLPSTPTTSQPPPSTPTTSQPPPSTPTTSQPPPSTPTTSQPPPSTPTTSQPLPSTTSQPPPSTPTTSQPPPSTPTTSQPLPSTTSQPPLKPAVPNRLNSSSCRPVSSADTAVSKTSRWAQFLTSPSPEEQEEEFLSQHVDRDGDPVQDYTKAAASLPGCASSSSQHASSSSLFHRSSSHHASPSSMGLLPKDGFLGRKLGSSFSRLRSTLSLCGFGDVTHGNRSPAPVALYQREETVCHQPPPTKRPRPSLPATSLFNTDEDFDDAFEL